jgi:hypothetical protein
LERAREIVDYGVRKFVVGSGRWINFGHLDRGSAGVDEARFTTSFEVDITLHSHG